MTNSSLKAMKIRFRIDDDESTILLGGDYSGIRLKFGLDDDIVFLLIRNSKGHLLKAVIPPDEYLPSTYAKSLETLLKLAKDM
jgi:hypothetical protein